MGRSIGRRRLVERLAVGACVVALVVALFPLGHIIYTALSIGGKKLSWSFLSQPASGKPYPTEGGVLNGIVGTSILLFIGGLVAVPLGVLTGLYLAEFGRSWFAGVVRTISDTLLGVPSVIWGLFGYLLFTNVAAPIGFHWDRSALAGGVTLGMLMTPIVARVTELAVLEVPLSYREASFALGATRWATMRRIGLRVARPGIVTGVLLALTNAIGQTAAILMTNNYTQNMPGPHLTGPTSNVTDLAALVYQYSSYPSPDVQPPAEAAVMVLLGLILVISLLSRTLTALGRRTHV